MHLDRPRSDTIVYRDTTGRRPALSMERNSLEQRKKKWKRQNFISCNCMMERKMKKILIYADICELCEDWFFIDCRHKLSMEQSSLEQTKVACTTIMKKKRKMKKKTFIFMKIYVDLCKSQLSVVQWKLQIQIQLGIRLALFFPWIYSVFLSSLTIDLQPFFSAQMVRFSYTCKPKQFTVTYGK